MWTGKGDNTPGYLGMIEFASEQQQSAPTGTSLPPAALDGLKEIAQNSQVGGKICIQGRADLCPALIDECQRQADGGGGDGLFPDDPAWQGQLSRMCKEVVAACGREGEEIGLSADLCVEGTLSLCQLNKSLCGAPQAAGGGGPAATQSKVCAALNSICAGSSG